MKFIITEPSNEFEKRTTFEKSADNSVSGQAHGKVGMLIETTVGWINGI